MASVVTTGVTGGAGGSGSVRGGEDCGVVASGDGTGDDCEMATAGASATVSAVAGAAKLLPVLSSQ